METDIVKKTKKIALQIFSFLFKDLNITIVKRLNDSKNIWFLSTNVNITFVKKAMFLKA